MGVVSSDQWNYKRKIIPYLKKMDMYLINRVKLILGGGFELDLPNFKNLENIKFVKSFEEFDKMLHEISSQNIMKKIAIVGSGISGTSAAYQFNKIGYDVSINFILENEAE